MNKTEPQVNTTDKGAISSAKIALFTVFIGFIAVFSLLLLVLKKHEGELSPNERRMLAAAPNPSIENIMSGKFSSQVDTWMQDHFPLRNVFVGIYSYANRLTGRNAVENVVLCENSRLINAPIEKSEKGINSSVDRLKNFIEKNDLDACAYIVPSSGYMLESALPKSHLTYHDGEILSEIDAKLSRVMKSVSVENLFKKQSEIASLYYRTDHHLTMRGSYVLYRSIGEELGFKPLDESEFTKTAYDFYGTSYGKSGLFLTPADKLETWLGEYDKDLKVTTIDGSVETEHIGSLDMAQLDDGVVDKYAAYLYSNHAITKIENENADGGVLLVLKDSYGNAIVPFLAAHYRTIIMIDTRSMYYGVTMPSPSDLCDEYGVNDFLVLMGIDTVAAGSIDMLR